MDYLKFRDDTDVVDSKLLTRLVQKHNIEYVTKPLERRQLWLILSKEYNAERGTNLNHARLAKRWHNMKQRAKKQISQIKQKAIKQYRKNPNSRFKGLGQSPPDAPGIDHEEGEGEFDALGGNDEEGGGGGEGDSVPFQNADEMHSKHKQDELLRDLLICLARKYRVEEAKRGPASKLRMWTDLSREYHRMSGGILNASAKQLQNKWNNIKFSARQKMKANPYEDATWDKHEEVIAQKLVPFKRILQDEHVEKEIEAHLQQDYLFASAMHGHKMSLMSKDQDRGSSPPPDAPPTKKRAGGGGSNAAPEFEMESAEGTVGVVSGSSFSAAEFCSAAVNDKSDALGAGSGSGSGGDVSSHNKTLRNIEKQIYMETLRFEQERLKMFKDNAELERQKLLKDVEASEIQLQLMRAELERQQTTIRILP